MYQLSEEHIDIVYERLECEGLKSKKLAQDLFDHYCCYIESRMEEGAEFEQAYGEAVAAISPNGTKEIEFELFFIINFNKQVSMKKLIFLSGFISAFLISTGIMFKTLHWPGANVLMVTGFAAMLLTAIITTMHLIKYMRNKPGTFWLRSGAGVAALFLISAGFIFKTFHMPGANVMYTLGTVILNFIFLPMFFYHAYIQGMVKHSTNENVS
jgi:hypothetical protein